ncbi:hypothetical protein OKW41_004606 [Paraburkholderia sp. UCT70]
MLGALVLGERCAACPALEEDETLGAIEVAVRRIEQAGFCRANDYSLSKA